jgi:formylmethanofuran dehydrogenase subunit C
MKPLVFSLRESPDQRVDLAPLVPHRLAGKSDAEIARIELQTTKEIVRVGDVFRLRAGDPRSLRFEGGSERFDMIGCEMNEGEIVVEGDVGIQAGRLMTGGRLMIRGNAGPWAASGMRGGVIEIAKSAGDRLGGPLAGEMAGMRGGVVIVRGDAGERAGDRMRRGLIVIEKSAGRYSGARMIAGTVLVVRRAGPFPGYLMKRGTIVAGICDRLSPTFVDCGTHELVAMRAMAGYVADFSSSSARLLRRSLQRFAGDMAVLGKGEVLVASA